MAKQLSALETIKRNLGALDRDELGEVADLVAALLAIDETANDEPAADEGNDQAAKGSQGWIEYKTINGCGPYAYLRCRVAGKMKSTYIGKAPAAVAAQ